MKKFKSIKKLETSKLKYTKLGMVLGGIDTTYGTQGVCHADGVCDNDVPEIQM